jgi:Carboxypeptidase regulatory-like domain
MILFRKFFGLLLVLGLFSMDSFADINGKITGTVTDPSGGIIVSAAVTATQVETGERKTVQTDSNGNYSVLALPPGQYNLEVQSSGFQMYIRQGIKVDVNSALQLNVAMALGSSESKVVVAADALNVEVTNTQLGDVVGGKIMENLPLNGRSYTDLLGLQPGVVPVSSLIPDTIGVSASASAETGNVSINGQRESANGFMVNGGNIEQARNNGAAIVPNLDSIAEFRVITNNIDAEYGHYAGALISVITKSGANEFHGSAFEFLRNTALDSRNFYDTQRGLFRRNQFGATFGGPVIHDKVFFFVDYQGTRELRGISGGKIPVPTTDQRNGDFSGPAIASALTGSVSSLYWASVLSQRLGYAVTSGERYYTPGCNSPAQCVYPNAIIPQATFSSAAKGLLQYIPMPTPGQGNSTFVGSNNNWDTSANQGGVRVDANTRLGTISGYYSIYDSSLIRPYGANNVPGFANLDTSHPQLINLSDTKSFGSTAVNEVRLTVVRYVSWVNNPTQGFGPKLTSLGFPAGVPGGMVPADPRVEGVPTLVFNNFTQGIPQFDYQQYQTSPQVVDNFSKIIRSHSTKFGAEYHYTRWRQRVPEADANGLFTFTGAETGSDFADYLIGAPTLFLQSSDLDYDNRKNYVGLYAQDSWRIRPNLTLNYGLRWEIVQNWYEKNNATSDTFIVGEQSKVYPTAPVGFVFAGDPRPGGGKLPRTVSNTPFDNFAPRIGIAYSPSADDGVLHWLLGGTGKTSIRAAYGMFYANNAGYQAYLIQGAPPFVAVWTSPAPPLFERPYVDRTDGLIRQSPPYPYVAPPPGTTTNINWELPLNGVPVWNIHNRTPYAEDYHFTIQREFGPATVLSVGYVGSQGHALMDALESNPGNSQLCLSLSNASQVMPGTPTCGPFGENTVYTRANGTVVNSTRGPLGANFVSNPYYTTIGNSNYNSLQVSLRHTSNRLTFEAGYGFSKSIDDASDERDFVLNPYNQGLSRSLSSFDIPQSFEISYNYLLPLDRLGDNRWQRLLGGWRLAGITRFASGLPVQLYETDDRGLVGEFFGFLDTPIYNGAKLQFTNPRSGQPFFDTSAFSAEMLGALNTTHRRFFHGPGINNFDLSLLKDTRISERISAQFRAEFFNVFNHAQFMNPSGNFSSSAFGMVLSARDPRIGQVAMKILF